jgi:hypothetical protein
MNERPKRHPELNLLRACVAIVLAPLVLRGTSCGQDFDFHLESWMEAARQWRQGVLCPHWVASANFGAGEPRFIFYPPLSWILGGILGTIFPWTWTPVAFTAICVLALGIGFYKMACEWMPSPSAEIGACLYAASPYIFFVIYERSALGELLAAVWLPLLVLYALRQKPSTPQLALVVAALWLTNAPAAVMGSYALVIVAAVAAVSQRRFALLARAASGLALGLGLAAVYIVPAIYEQRWVQIARAVMPGMRVQDSFLFEHTGMAYHDQVLRTASWISVVLLIATAAAAVVSYLTRKSQPREQQYSPVPAAESATDGSGLAKRMPGRPVPLRKPLLALAILIAFLLFPVSKFLWNFLPELRFLQFPWRWLLVLGLVFATLAGLALRESIPSRHVKIFRAAAVLLVAVIFCAHAWRHFWLRCDEEDNVRAQVATLDRQGFEGTDEYTPKGADNGDIQQNLAPIRVLNAPGADQADSSVEENPDWDPSDDDLVPAIIQFQHWKTEHITAEIQSPQPGYAVLRLMDYPAWRVLVNGNPVPRRGQHHRDDGLITVPIPAGTSTIDVRYTATPDLWAGRIVSVLSLAIWAVLLLAHSAKSRAQQL